ncbi:hypothetical protein SAMN05444156_0536 [Verrucomicrobium sp. GAS474]|uniref:DUF6580 family putative transport protein n=1 Tax=Verrucomicrobium sp. GAS474 TaxID=1882831 RepID=UPI0008795D40|nr:DUF6580 family putative transport protein [Verrucomicrobium sp. GAS474]SDT89729.1 hypothetical protein SAMN05444156_0536 [Verrucomicrobium sp. GAS474]
MNPRFTFLASLVLAAAALRVIPHPANFTPVAAIALFAGARFADRRMAFLVPLAAMALSDLVLNLRSPNLALALTILPIVYAAFALTVVLGFLLRGRSNALAIAGTGVLASVLFFGVTNLGVWAVGGIYPHTATGLADCYAAAIPFYRNGLLGTLFFSAVLFGGFALAERRFEGLREPRPVAA